MPCHEGRVYAFRGVAKALKYVAWRQWRGTVVCYRWRAELEDQSVNARTTMLNRLRRRKPRIPLERDFYCSPADYQVDLDLLWYHEWLFVGHDCEIPNKGNYFTVQVGDYPVVVVRGRDGAVHAFHNSCRHRGSRICSAARGTLARLVCPYHAWTYQLDGRLLSARDMGGDFDKEKFGLKPVHCRSVAGYVWISLSNAPPDFEPIARHIEPYFAPHQLQHAKVAFESTIVEKANWKLVWENNRECYHCTGNHPELIRTFSDDPTVTGIEGAAAKPFIAEKWSHWESAGLPSKFHIAGNGQYRTARMPLLEGKVSYTMDGSAAVRKPLADTVTLPDIGTLLLYHFPSTWNHVLGDHAITFRMLPISAGETQLTTKWLVHQDAVEGVDYDLERMTEVWLATNEADRRICQENQIGVQSPAYDPAPYSPVHEGGVTQFVDWYCTALERRLAHDDAR
jgi:Rieske 2Fe-2S family protein